jgi:AIG2 family protein
MSGDLVWYFAYGSNMQPATFAGRRGIVAARALPARLAGWQLVFDKPPLLPMGQGMANVVATPGAEVLGVAHAITADDLAHVDLTEGVLIENYRRFEAWTLTSDRRADGLLPSERYMELLIDGALHHGLPAEYVAWLRARPAVADSPESLEVRAFIDRALKKEPR